MRALAAFLVLGGASVSCSPDKPDSAACERVRDHIVDIRVDAYGSAKDAVGGTITLEPHRRALQRALGEGFIKRCVATMSPEQIHCAIDATTSEQAQVCMSDTHQNKLQ
jgi:hypothetical protein